MTSKLQITVFNCWQSDLPADTHRNAIRGALRKAIKSLNKKLPEVKIKLDEALRESSGAPNISVNIREKIDKADIIVADISTITVPGSVRHCPNPNVIFELGLGVATVGWLRTIMLFNGEPQAGEIPFDISQHRVSRFTVNDKSDTAGLQKLEELLEKAVRDIIEQNPKRPEEERGLSSDQIKHQRDMDMVRWLMEHLHVPSASHAISLLPQHILHRHLWFFEHFKEVAASTSFHLYDKKLAEAVASFKSSWDRAFCEDAAYTDMPGGEGYVFSRRMSGGHGEIGDARLQRIEAARNDMQSALDEILECVRNDYLEIDINETNKVAWEAYNAFHREVDAP